MSLLKGPLFCESASGTLTPGLTTRTTRGRTHFMRQPISHKPRSEAQRTQAMFLGQCAKLFAARSNSRAKQHANYPNIPLDDIYRYWMQLTHERHRKNQWPGQDYKETPIGAIPTIGDPTITPHARALTFYENSTSAADYMMAALTYSITPALPITPLTTTHWFQSDKYYHITKLVNHLPAGNLYITYVLIDKWGRASLPNNTGPYLIEP